MIVQCLLIIWKIIPILPHIHTSLLHLWSTGFTRTLPGTPQQEEARTTVAASLKEIKVFKSNATPIMTRLVKKKNSRQEEKKKKNTLSSPAFLVSQLHSQKHPNTCKCAGPSKQLGPTTRGRSSFPAFLSCADGMKELKAGQASML